MFRKLSLLALLLFSIEASAQTQFIKYKSYLIPIGTSDFRECTASDPGGAKPRVIVLTDINRASHSNHLLSLADPDDIQSMVHLLASSNQFVTRGLISTPSIRDITVFQEREHIENLIEAYKQDFNNSNSTSLSALGYPQPSELSSVVRQGLVTTFNAKDLPYDASDPEHQGAKLIIDEATAVLDGTNCGPLHVLVWGPINDLTLALKESERIGRGIEKALRVYFIASSNRIGGERQRSYDYIRDTFLNADRLWFIQSEFTFAGMGFVSTSKQLAFLNSISNANSTFNQSCLSFALRRASKAININPNQTQFWIKAGDTPSLLHVMDPSWSLDPAYPNSPNWGGQYNLVSGKEMWWDDGPGASSVLVNVNPTNPSNPSSSPVYSDWATSMNRFTKSLNSSCINTLRATITD